MEPSATLGTREEGADGTGATDCPVAPGASGATVDTGCLVAMDATVRYEVRMQAGIASGLFGGEGFFLVQMTGPGKVTLQTLPFARTAHAVLEAGGRGKDERGGGGGLLGNIL